MLNTYKIKIVLPTKVFLYKEVVETKTQDSLGKISFMANYEPTLKVIKSGQITIIDKNGVSESYNTSDGILEFSNNELKLLLTNISKINK